jgi:hypothetical protein
MTLLSQPFDPFVSSEESHELALRLAPEVKVALGLKRFATNQYVYHLERIVLNSFLTHSSNPDKCMGISRGKNYYDGKQDLYRNQSLSYTYMVKTLDALENLGFLKMVQEGWIDLATERSETTRYKPGQSLIDLFDEYDLNHQSVVKEAVPVRLRGKKPRKTRANKNPKGKLISYRPTKQTKLMTKNLTVINNALSEADINLYISNDEMNNLNAAMRNKHEEDPSKLPEIQFSRKWLYRVFNESFEKGGRFYGGFWQEIPSAYRSRLTIDHCITYEIDFSSLHAAILYLKEGYKREDFMDPYQLTKDVGLKSFDAVKKTRDAIKVAMNIMFNTTNRYAALGAIEATGLEAPQKYDGWLATLKAIEAYHEPIAHYFYANKGLEIQALDSQIVEMIMLEMVKQETVFLPVHDSFVCKAGDLGLLIETMNKATTHYLGSDLFLTLDPPKVQRPEKPLTACNSNFYKRRNHYLKRFNTQEEAKEPYIL